MELKNFIQDYKKVQSEIEAVRNRICQREKQIARLKIKESRLVNNGWWGNLIRPIMKLVKEKFPQIKWDDERLVPMGLCCRVSVFGELDRKDDGLMMLCFVPHYNGIAYETGERR